MTSVTKFALLGVLVAAGTVAALTARAQTSQPGVLGTARVWVENRTPEQTIPVAVQNSPLRVELERSAALPVYASRQIWEYRTALVPPDGDASTLRPVGGDGWEAVGVLQTGRGGSTILFKRPR